MEETYTNPVEAAVNKAGYEFIGQRELNSFLQVVMAHKQLGSRTEYVTWLFNSTLAGNTGGLVGGRYTFHKDIAQEHFATRR